ncbi:hypothetical protein BUMB_02437 [Candidatus Paraburkholderia calva]|nr:hypothetical protein BUMB_02437 [Candidatus Paraburkholderia calva]
MQTDALEANDLQRFSISDTAFHLTLAEGAGNGLLLQQLTVIHDKIRLTRGREYTVPNWIKYSIDEHSRVLSALTRRDATIGIAEMTYHIRSVVDLHFGMRRRKDLAAGVLREGRRDIVIRHRRDIHRQS